MKLIIVAAASLAIAGSALAALPSATAEQKPSLETGDQAELAWGQTRSGSKAPSSGKHANSKSFG